MKFVHRILIRLKSVIERDGDRRRERVERKPSGEQMESRALQSALEAGVAPVVLPNHHSGGALVISVDHAPSFHVTYQAIHNGASSWFARPSSVEPAPTAQAGSAETLDMTPADDTGDDSTDASDDDDGDDTDGDDDNDNDNDGGGNDDDNDNDDEIDDENDVDGGP